MSSLTPVTITVCGESQLAGVKIILLSLKLPSDVFTPEKLIVTFAEGFAVSTRVN